MQPKKLIIFIAAILIFIVSPKVFANPTKVKVLESTESKIVLQVEFSEPQFTSVETPRGKAFVVSADKAYPILSEGMPDVPRVAESIIIPDLGTMEISVIDVDCRIIDDIEIAPSKGNILRTINPDDVPYVYGDTYQKNKFYPEKNVSLDTPYILRDYRGQVVAFYPVQYNPVTKQLRVNKTIRVTLVHNDVEGENELIRNNPTQVNLTFDQIYRNRFLNYENSTRYTPVNEVGNLLIVSHSNFMEAIQPFVAWKKQIGIPTELVEWSTIGTTFGQLQTYVNNYYETQGLTFLLLVGDGEYVPSIKKGSAYCDPSYGHIVGNDAYAEVIVGRFSVENVEQLQNQIQKTLMYESQPDVNADWYKKYTLIASNEGGGSQGDNGESDVQHSRVIKQKLLNYNYTSGDELYDGSHGQEDAPGNPSPQMVVSAINQGRGYINYVGHGSVTSLGSSGFSVSHMSGLSNNTQFPFMIDVACVNGDFVGKTCFAEGFIRASNANGPTGVLAICASTINQTWAPPMAGQDEMIDLLVKSYQNNKKYTYGGIVVNGCMFMNDKYGSGGASMTETWTIFGDPTVMVRTNTPQTLEVSHNNIIF
ncbi:MAG TPA: C25 family cysteine peptidase, partial [Salinivirgaceae bacterium]|nr:C25 family cysteine peptidase [Salinivirgaceae bacterium]